MPSKPIDNSFIYLAPQCVFDCLKPPWRRAHHRGAAEKEADVAMWRGVRSRNMCDAKHVFFKTSLSVTSKIAFVALTYTIHSF